MYRREITYKGDNFCHHIHKENCRQIRGTTLTFSSYLQGQLQVYKEGNSYLGVIYKVNCRYIGDNSYHQLYNINCSFRRETTYLTAISTRSTKDLEGTQLFTSYLQFNCRYRRETTVLSYLQGQLQLKETTLTLFSYVQGQLQTKNGDTTCHHIYMVICMYRRDTPWCHICSYIRETTLTMSSYLQWQLHVQSGDNSYFRCHIYKANCICHIYKAN